MSDTYDCLTAWRQAERLRDAIPRDCSEWLDAEQEVRHACLVYQATVVRTAAQYQEAADPPRSAWWPILGSIHSSPAR